jgi:hypothetical protein
VEADRLQLGAPERNTRLTALTGAVLLVLLAVEGVTLISLQSLLSWHIFVGVLVVPVVALKLGSTGYRFFRYYTRRPDFVRAGPPQLLLRMLGPLVVLSTVGLLATGVALIVVGPGGGVMLNLHKASFAVWLVALGAHVLAHIGRLLHVLRTDLTAPRRPGGSRLRYAVVAGAVVVGTTAAVAVLMHGTPWLHWARVEH